MELKTADEEGECESPRLLPLLAPGLRSARC